MREHMEEFEEKMSLEQELSGMERCPLTSAAKAIANIEGAVMLIIGTEECTYYTMSGLTRRGRGDSCYSVVMDKHDVTFGSADKVAAAIEELLTDTKPSALFIITTCVPEIIGEDYQSIVQEAEKKFKLPIHLLITNHYSGKDGEYGIELVEKAVGYALPRRKKGDGPKHHKRGGMGHPFSGNGHGGRPEGGRHEGGRPEGGRPEGGRPEGGRPRGDMNDEEKMEMMRKKMGGHMSEEEMRAKMKSRMGGDHP